MTRRREKGFTLVETVVALLVAALIGAVVMTAAVSSGKADRKVSDKLFAENFSANALEIYKFTAASAPIDISRAYLTNLNIVYTDTTGASFDGDKLTLYATKDGSFSDSASYYTATLRCGTDTVATRGEYYFEMTITSGGGKILKRIDEYRIIRHD